MTAKDFQFIADVLAASTVTANLTDVQREDLAYAFARKLAETNARFKPAMFFTACDIDARKVPHMVACFERNAAYLPIVLG